jgi:hypothetical protein
MKLPSPAMVVALIALFVALGGTSYAVTQLPRNSVGTAQIKDRSILASDIKSSEIRKLKGPAGSSGPAGPTGPTGATGPAGPTGAGHVIDATGQIIGDLLDTMVENNFTTYTIKIGPNAWRFDQEGVLIPWDQTVWSNSSCSGTPFLIENQSGPARQRVDAEPYQVIQSATPAGTKAYLSPAWAHTTWAVGTAYYEMRNGTCQPGQEGGLVSGEPWALVNDLVEVTPPTIVGPLRTD